MIQINKPVLYATLGSVVVLSSLFGYIYLYDRPTSTDVAPSEKLESSKSDDEDDFEDAEN